MLLCCSAWFQRLKLNCFEPLSTFAFKFNLRRYTKAKQDKVHEIKRLNANITTIRSELNKYEEQLEAGAYTRSHFRTT